MQGSIPASLIREQMPAITGMTTGLFWSLTPAAIKSRLVDTNKPITSVVHAGSDKLIEHYIDWCEVNDDRYTGVLPPHFFAKYGMGLVAKLTGQSPFNMLKVVNQGCRMQVNHLIPRNTPIHLSGELVDCSVEDNRARVHTRVTVSTPDLAQAMVVDSLAAVILGKQAKKKKASKAKEPELETIGQWAAGRDEGQKFFYLTGDFNPIHTFWPLAKRSRFGGCILHGFATFARTYESIQNAGHQISDIDIRFIKPNLLPNPELIVKVEKQADSTGRRQLRLVNGSGITYLAGSFIAGANQ